MKIIDLNDHDPVIHEMDFMVVHESGRIAYNQDGVQQFSALFREYGFDIRTIETISDHHNALMVCMMAHVVGMVTNPPPEARLGQRVITHIDQYVELTIKGKNSLAKLHEEAIYALEGLTSKQDKELYFLNYIMPKVPPTRPS